MGATKPAQKSLFVTYFLWLFGGFFGLHHFYLGRDDQAFLWWCTLGGYLGLGWIRDAFYIPRYVAEANEDPKYVEKYIGLLKTYVQPPFSMARFSGMLVVGYLFGALVMYAIPEEPVLGIDWSFLLYLVPLACAVGVWLVGNIGREQGSLWWPLAAAYAAYPFSLYFEEESTWFTLMVLASTMAFDNLAKGWRRKPKKKRGIVRRASSLAVCGCLYLSLWTSYVYFNAKLTDSEGEEIPIHEAVNHFFKSPWYVDLYQSFQDVWIFAQHHGWYETWKQIVDFADPHGEINAYKVLGVESDATQSEITSKYRTLSKEFHPDKIQDPAKKKEAQEKFMEIQQAYEILSNIKNRRKNKNKKSQTA